MKKITAELVDFAELEFPRVVYKYRQLGNPFHRTILSERIIYLSPPGDFPDKLDCRLPVRYDLMSDEEIRDYFI